jgi:hypothetical protein
VRRRRVRATFLLRCVTLAVSFGLFLLVFGILSSPVLSVSTFLILCAVWFLGIECDLLPTVLEGLLLRRAGRAGGSMTSIWFVDRDALARRQGQSTTSSSSDNPTIR